MCRLLILALFVAPALSAKVTPIEKVTQLLKGLQAKVEAEGKKEAAAYDKMACFCKEQADEKLYSIEKSRAKIADLTASIDADAAEIASLDGDISKLGGEIAGLEGEIKTDTDARKVEHDAYLVKAADLQGAIDSTVAAIAAMKDAKGDLKNAKVNLMQLRSLAEKHLGKQAPAKYQFQGNDIIATLEGLLADFKQMKATMDTDEFDVNSVFEKKTLGNNNEKTFKNKEKDEKAKLSEATNERKSANEDDRTQENKDKDADQSFLDQVEAKCETAAKVFDQRSSTRSDEINAMSKAMGALEGGVKANEGANNKLVGLVQEPSFLQLQHTLQEDGNRAVRKVQAFLQEAAMRLDSAVLKGAAARVMVSADHFVKVRGLIKDLIQKLKDDAKSEAEQKSFCDKAMKKAVDDRDAGSTKKEAQNAKLTSEKADKERLTQEIADLAAKMAENAKALNEAAELRDGEKTENEETIQSAEDGKTAIEYALNTLNDFYKSAFVQTAAKFTPKDSDRDGNTFEDLAPGGTGEDYHGAQGAAKGIVGIMEVIASDFTRTIKTVTDQEADAQSEFEKFEKDNSDDTKQAQDDTDAKDKSLKEAESNILDATSDLKDAVALYDSGMDKLDDLKASCVEGEETWEERAAARKKEIEALKDAQNILDEWKN